MTEQEKRLHRACFTGHRPDKLIGKEDVVRLCLRRQIDAAIEDGYTTFISGMCPGVDIIAAELILEKERSNPDIHLIAAMPYPRFAFNWDGWGERVKAVYYQCESSTRNLVCNVSKNYTGRGVFQIRNEWMINHSNLLIACWDGTKGGTKNTVDYGIQKGIQFINCYPKN